MASPQAELRKKSSRSSRPNILKPKNWSALQKGTCHVSSARSADRPSRYRAVYRLRDGNLSERREIVGHQGGGLRPLRYPRNR
jgi:hypothetical protein